MVTREYGLPCFLQLLPQPLDFGSGFVAFALAALNRATQVLKVVPAVSEWHYAHRSLLTSHPLMTAPATSRVERIALVTRIAVLICKPNFATIRFQRRRGARTTAFPLTAHC
jgi:hypothetical protein